ncbi:MAG: hypothetical protein ABI813_01750, partial [Bacteroidota bacterium]
SCTRVDSGKNFIMRNDCGLLFFVTGKGTAIGLLLRATFPRGSDGVPARGDNASTKITLP